MFLLDVNVLVALCFPNHVHHTRSLAWFASRDGDWATTPITELGLLRLAMNRYVAGRDVRIGEALTMLHSIRGVDGHRFLPDDSSPAVSRVGLDSITGPRQLTDRHLVDLAVGSGARLATLDKGIPAALARSARAHVTVLP